MMLLCLMSEMKKNEGQRVCLTRNDANASRKFVGSTRRSRLARTILNFAVWLEKRRDLEYKVQIIHYKCTRSLLSLN